MYWGAHLQKDKIPSTKTMKKPQNNSSPQICSIYRQEMVKTSYSTSHKPYIDDGINMELNMQNWGMEQVLSL